MGNKGTIKCESCNSEIKWYRTEYININEGNIKFVARGRDERPVNDDGIVYCNVCDKPNHID